LKENYQLLTIVTSAADSEAFADLLWSEDCLGYQEDESSGNLLITAWFPAGAEGVESRIRNSARVLGLACFDCSVLRESYDPSEGIERFNRHFTGVGLDEVFFIHPPWVAPSPLFPVNILLEPGHAFGTGTHESTQLALAAMRPVLGGASSFLDVGTGSGILAAAAGKLNPSVAITICDIDETAVESAVETLRRNGMEAFTAVTGGPEVFTGNQFQVVAANLTSPVIISLLPVLASLASRHLIIAGFTRDQQQETVGGFLQAGFVQEAVHTRNDWVSCRLRKTNEQGIHQDR